MTHDYLAGFRSLGFPVADEPGSFVRFLNNAWAVATGYPGQTGETRLLAEEYARLWMHADGDEPSTILESNALPGLVGSLENLPGTQLIRLWVLDPTDSSQLYPICVAVPHKWHGTLPVDGTPLMFSITVITDEVRVFPDESSFHADPDFGNLSTSAVIPTGLLGENAASPTNHALFTGKVLLAVKSLNTFGSSHFWALRVRTWGGEIWVALPGHALAADPTGQFVVAHGSISGSSPELTPAALVEDHRAEGGIDGAKVESSIRELWRSFARSPEFEGYFFEIHANPGVTRLLKGISVFNSTRRKLIADSVARGGLGTPALMARYRNLDQSGHIVMARIVMANRSLMESGTPAPALVVIAFGNGADAVMSRAASVLARIHFDRPENPDETELAASIEDEDYQFGRRRRLPRWLAGEVESYAADLWLPATALNHETLKLDAITCLAEPGPEGVCAALPMAMVFRAMDGARDPAKPPPLPGATPPPLPPRA